MRSAGRSLAAARLDRRRFIQAASMAGALAAGLPLRPQLMGARGDEFVVANLSLIHI